MTETAENHWRRCSSCKKPLFYLKPYWVCNVSTCNRKRTGLIFCTVSCWDAHSPLMNHRESWAEERMAPSAEEWQKIQAGESSAKPEEKEAKQHPTKENAAKEASAPSLEPSAVASAPKVIRRVRTET